mgnify:FL=1
MSNFKTETFEFSEIPSTLDELKSLPEAKLETPFMTAALTVLALCRYEKDVNSAIEMINFLKGPVDLTEYDKQFLRDRLKGKSYVPRSYFEGTSPENDYTPPVPLTIKVFEYAYSYSEDGYAMLEIRSSGADSPRQIKLRKKGSEWFLWQQYLLPDIRTPKKDDAWA